TRSPHPEVLRRAIHLALTAEAEGLPRAARVAALARTLMTRVPGEAWAALVLGRALLQMGEKEDALAAFRRVERTAEETTLGAEAQRARFALEKPDASVELDSVLRAAHYRRVEDLATIAERAQRLADEHEVWVPHYALGLA